MMLTEHFDTLNSPEGYHLPKVHFVWSLAVSGQVSERRVAVFPVGSLVNDVLYLFTVQSNGGIFSQGSECE